MPNFICFQVLRCLNLLLFFVILNSKLNIFWVSDCWSGKTRRHLGFWEIVKGIFTTFWHFMDRTMNRLIAINHNLPEHKLTYLNVSSKPRKVQLDIIRGWIQLVSLLSLLFEITDSFWFYHSQDGHHKLIPQKGEWGPLLCWGDKYFLKGSQD